MSNEERETDKSNIHDCCVPTMKINCDLEVNVGSKNKVIYVSPGKLQYFTASAICCSGNDLIEVEYCGCNIKCIYGETFICGRLGYYKVVSSGIIFMPKHNLSKYSEHYFPTDILHFKAKNRCGEVVEFVVVFTFSKCIDHDGHCCKK